MRYQFESRTDTTTRGEYGAHKADDEERADAYLMRLVKHNKLSGRVDVCLYEQTQDEVKEATRRRTVHERRRQTIWHIRFPHHVKEADHPLNDRQLSFPEMSRHSVVHVSTFEAGVQQREPKVKHRLLPRVELLSVEFFSEQGVAEVRLHCTQDGHDCFHVQRHLCAGGVSGGCIEKEMRVRVFSSTFIIASSRSPLMSSAEK